MICILLIQDEPCPSKNLLQELSERECFSKPTYKTTQIGSPDMPTFFSTVEVEGIGFHGKASKSENEAEEDAAKIAYITLKECKFIHLVRHSCLRITLRENFDITKQVWPLLYVEKKTYLQFEMFVIMLINIYVMDRWKSYIC